MLRGVRAKTEKLLKQGYCMMGRNLLQTKKDLLAIDDVLKTVFEGMLDPEVVRCPLGNREKVMNRV